MSEPATVNVDTLRAAAAVCRRCKHEYGEVVGGELRIGRARIRQRLTFFCECGGRNTFRPRGEEECKTK